MRNERFDFLYLPKEFQKAHKTCEFLLYQIEDFLTKETYSGLRSQRIEFEEEPAFQEEENILDYLTRTGKLEKRDEIITSNLLNSLISDSCQFLQMALFASLQKRLTVSFALMRKPFVYNLIVILRLYFTADFLEKFNESDKFDTTDFNAEDIQELLKLSENALITKSIQASDIYAIVFDRNDSGSLLNLSNKALHPSTTQNKNNLTGKQNLNFVFSTTKDLEKQWDYIYSKLPLLLLYLNEILEFIVFQHLNVEDEIYTERVLERLAFLDSEA